jgi:hypothetical protein
MFPDTFSYSQLSLRNSCLMLLWYKVPLISVGRSLMKGESMVTKHGLFRYVAIPLIIGLVQVVALSAVQAGEKEGVWIAKKTISKHFTTWSVRAASGRPMLRHYFTTTRYYDQVGAVITLKESIPDGFIRAGDLVFFDDSVRELPIDRSVDYGPPLLFYRMSEYSTVLQTLQTHKTGYVDWFYFEEQVSQDQIAGYVVGQMRFDDAK